MSKCNVLYGLVLCIVTVAVPQVELKAQWDPTDSEGFVNWNAINKTYDFMQHVNLMRKARQTLLATQVPKAEMSNPSIAKLFSGKWDMYRNPGSAGTILDSRDINAKEYTLVFGFGNNTVQKKRVIAVFTAPLAFTGRPDESMDALFFSVESIQVKKLKAPWTLESKTFPAGTEIITMQLSDLMQPPSDVAKEGHIWDCTLVPYKNGWTGKLKDSNQITISEYERRAFGSSLMFEGPYPQTDFFQQQDRTHGYNMVHLVYLTPSTRENNNQAEPPLEDKTGIPDPQF